MGKIGGYVASAIAGGSVAFFAMGVDSHGCRQAAEQYTNQNQNIATLKTVLTTDQFDLLDKNIENSPFSFAKVTNPLKWQEAAEAFKGVSKDSVAPVLQRTIARLAKK